jgi:tetratricopeptide (TPR) repeat protein
VGSFEQALSALPYLPETRDTHEQTIDLWLAFRTALRPLGDNERILAGLHEAEALATALDDHRRLGEVLIALFVQLGNKGTYDQAIAAGERALALATASGDGVLHALVNLRLGQGYPQWGEYRRAIDCLRQAVAFFDGARRHEHFGVPNLPVVLSCAYLAWCYAELGMFAEGKACGDEGCQIAEAVAHPGSLMFAAWGIGLVAHRQGDLPKALPPLERAMDICRDVDLPNYFPRIAAALGATYTLSGRVADAVPLLTRALEQAMATDMAVYQMLCRLPLGEGAAAGWPPGGGTHPRRAGAGARPYL